MKDNKVITNPAYTFEEWKEAIIRTFIEKKPSVFMELAFIMLEPKKCYCTLKKRFRFKKEKTSTVMGCTFCYDESFKENFLEPLIKEYVDANIELDINCYVNNKMYDLELISFENSNVLVSGIDPIYASKLMNDINAYRRCKKDKTKIFK